METADAAALHDERVNRRIFEAGSGWQSPGGWSGGPVFRYAHEPPIERLELVGFIYAFPLGQAVLARHADAVLADGTLHEGTAHLRV